MGEVISIKKKLAKNVRNVSDMELLETVLGYKETYETIERERMIEEEAAARAAGKAQLEDLAAANAKRMEKIRADRVAANKKVLREYKIVTKP